MPGLFGLIQHEEAESERMQKIARSLRSKNFRRRKLKERVEALEEDLDLLNLLSLIVLSVLTENRVLTRDDIIGRMKKLDMLDGAEDCMVTPEALRKALNIT